MASCVKTVTTFLCVSLCLLTTISITASPTPLLQTDNDYYLSFFTGVSWQSSGETALVNFGDLNTNRYVANSTSSEPTSWSGIGAGYRWVFPRYRLWLDVGGEVSYTSTVSLAGTVQPLYLLSPDFDTLNFTYNTSSIPLFATAHLGYQLNRWFNPYLFTAIGLSVNRAFNYNEVPTDPSLSASAMRSMFSNKTSTDFAYSVGIGSNITLKKPGETLGIEYRYSNFGQATLGTTPGQETADQLSLGNISSHALIVSLTI